MEIKNIIPSHEEYSKAKKIVDDYESEIERLHNIKLQLFRISLENYFENNQISGYTIIKFRLDDEFKNHQYSIIPIDPSLEECYDGENNKDIEKIANECNIKAKFVYWMYHK